MSAKPMTKAERALPIVMSALMFALVAVLLPSVLRPADPLTNESAEFSPDAPPDEENSIVAALNRGSSATAGEGEGEGPGNVGPGALGPGEAEGAAPVKGPASRGRCFGKNPPRQVESVYAPPCVPAFKGDNGGRTHFGVTATEFRVAVFLPDSDTADEGPVDDPNARASTSQRTFLAMQNWFNKYFEFYGRQMRIFLVKQSINSSTQGAASAIRAKQQYQVFASLDSWATTPGTYLESINQEIITWMQWQDDRLLRKSRPYGWTFYASIDKTVQLANEVVCKQLVGKPPELNERRDTSFNYSQPRKLGLLLLEDSSRTGNEALIKAGIEKCGGSVEHTVKYAFEDASLATASGAMTQMRARGITTILTYTDHFTINLFAGEATSLGYWPEWFVPGLGAVDENPTTQDQDQAQWAHAFGLTFQEIPRAPQFRDDIRAVYEMDPSSTYNGAQIRSFQMLFGIATGVQLAGPNLNPTTYEKGMFKLPSRPPDPIWSQGGGYGPGDYSYIDYGMLVWWDPKANAADNGAKGSYRYMFDGKHYKAGEIPTTPVPWFKDGILTPEDPTIRDIDPTDVEGGS